MGGQRQSEPIQQNRQIRLRFDIARQGDDPPVGRRHDDVDHLHRAELVDDLARREAGGMLPGDGPQRLKEAERHERGEDVRLDPVVQLVVDGPEAEIVLQLSERILDFALDHVPLPERLRVAFRKVRAQEIGSLVVRAGLADALPVELPLDSTSWMTRIAV